jgi:transposase
MCVALACDDPVTVCSPPSDKMPKRTYQQYSADTKHSILLEYKRGVRGCGFHALAAKHHIHGGGQAVEYWYKSWDGTPQSLQKNTTSHKRRRLDDFQVEQHIRGYVQSMNEQGDQVIYEDVKQHIEQETGQSIAYSTLTRYGYRKANISFKRTTRTLTTEGM